MAKQTKKKNYTEDFRRDAVRLMRNRGKRTVAQIADDLGVTDGMLYRWAERLDKASTAKRNEQGETLEQENRRLRKDVERLRVERAILKSGLLREGKRVDIYRFIRTEKAEFSVRSMCRVFGVHAVLTMRGNVSLNPSMSVTTRN